jgi:hypothetical protein
MAGDAILTYTPYSIGLVVKIPCSYISGCREIWILMIAGTTLPTHLHQALEKDGLGEVTGGGTQFSEPDENGDDHVEFCGIDVDLYNAVKGLALLRRELVRLHAPAGTVLVYQLDRNQWEEPVYGVRN